jgi:hypothetical protein
MRKQYGILSALFILFLALSLIPSTVEAKQTPLPYHFQNANVYYQRGKTHVEWYNQEAGRYSIYEYRYVRQANGKLNFEPHVVWSRYLRVGNVRVSFNRKGLRWKVIYTGPQ